MGKAIARTVALAVVCAASPAGAKPKVDPVLIATAKACALPIERIAPTEAVTARDPPADAEAYGGTSWVSFAGLDRVELDDDDGDHRPDERSREIATPDVEGRIDCRIDERWSRGRWRLVKVARFENLDEIVTTFRDDRPVHVDRRSAIVE